MGELLNFLQQPDDISWQHKVVTENVGRAKSTAPTKNGCVQSSEYRIYGVSDTRTIRPRSNMTYEDEHNRTITFKNVHYLGNGEAVAEDIVIEDGI
jgi:hypothetical protein